MAFYLVFSVHIYVIVLRLTTTQSLCTIIIIIKQVSPSSKIVLMFKKIIKVHPTFLKIYHCIINGDPVLSTAIRFVFLERLLDALINTWNSQNLKKLHGPFQMIEFISTLQLQGLPMTCNRVPTPISSPRIL